MALFKHQEEKLKVDQLQDDKLHIMENIENLFKNQAD